MENRRVKQVLSGGSYQWEGRWWYKERMKELNVVEVCTRMKMEKWDMLKLFQEWGEGEIKENDGGGEVNYDIL
jgi:hypothetical protein